MRLLRRLVFACCLNLLAALGAVAAPSLWVVLSEEGGAHAEVAATLRAELAPTTIVSGTPDRLFRDAVAPPDLILTVGVVALDATLERLGGVGEVWDRVPLLATLLPQAVFVARQAAGAGARRPLSAVVLDQPLARQMALIRHALPAARRVGVLPGPQTRQLLRPLADAADAQGLRLTVGNEVRGPKEVFPALRDVLADADVLLALPDAQIYNGATWQSILLTAYRARVPLVSFSAAHVKAGAVLGLSATPAQVARSAAAMVRQWAGGRGLPPPRAPQEFVVTSNARVAASLGIDLAETAAIEADLRRAEGGR